jgi:hypothetical protein
MLKVTGIDMNAVQMDRGRCTQTAVHSGMLTETNLASRRNRERKLQHRVISASERGNSLREKKSNIELLLS